MFNATDKFKENYINSNYTKMEMSFSFNFSNDRVNYDENKTANDLLWINSLLGIQQHFENAVFPMNYWLSTPFYFHHHFTSVDTTDRVNCVKIDWENIVFSSSSTNLNVNHTQYTYITFRFSYKSYGSLSS